MVFNGEQEKGEDGIEKSVPHDPRLSSLVMPNGDPWDDFFYPTFMMDLYSLFAASPETKHR